MAHKPKPAKPRVLPGSRDRVGSGGRGLGGDPGAGTSRADAGGGANRPGSTSTAAFRARVNAGAVGGRGANNKVVRPTVGGPGANGRPTETSGRDVTSTVRANGRPSETLGGDVTSTVRANGRQTEGASSHSSNPSSSQNTVSVSRTSLPAQYPPSTQPPTACQFYSPIQNHQPPPLVQVVEPLLPEDPIPEQEEYNGQFPDNDLDFEEEDEVEAPNPEAQDFEQLLDDQMHRPGREQLVRLSEHPIPDVKMTWFTRDDGELSRVISGIFRRKFDSPYYS